MKKEYFYTLFEQLHLMKPKLSFDHKHDYPLYLKKYNLVEVNEISSLCFETALAIFKDPHIYIIDEYAHKMINDTLIKEIPKTLPDLLRSPFMLETKEIISGYNLIIYSLENNDRYRMQIFSSDDKNAALCLRGALSTLSEPSNFTVKNIAKASKIPDESPEEIRKALFKYIFTFAILLKAEKTPIEIEGVARKMQNHYAKKAGVPKYLWTTHSVWLNAEIKRIYTEHTPMNMDGKKAVPVITKSHIRNILDKNGREKQVFVCSYVSTKYKRDRLVRNKVGVYNNA